MTMTISNVDPLPWPISLFFPTFLLRLPATFRVARSSTLVFNSFTPTAPIVLVSLLLSFPSLPPFPTSSLSFYRYRPDDQVPRCLSHIPRYDPANFVIISVTPKKTGLPFRQENLEGSNIRPHRSTKKKNIEIIKDMPNERKAHSTENKTIMQKTKKTKESTKCHI